MFAKREGQSVIEYLAIFAVIAAVTLLSMGKFDTIRQHCDIVFEDAAKEILGCE